jgi:hypothetical protein
MAPNSIIEGVRDYIKSYAGLESGAPVWVENLGMEPTEYAVLPIAGVRVIETNIIGKRTFEYPFALRSMESIADDFERLENVGFYENFAAWLDAQSEANSLPSLPAGLAAESIEATGWGYLHEEGESQTAVYQVQCSLIYYEE